MELYNTTTDLLDFATTKWLADDRMQIEDSYKWLYQATQGGEHAVVDERAARQWIELEWQTLGSTLADESLWEPLCLTGEVGRLNLRPFRAAGGSVDDLLAAFLTSSREYCPDAAEFISVWNELGLRLEKHALSDIDHQSWLNLDGTMKPLNYPAVHHSESYRSARNPAYRVLIQSEMRKLLE